MHECDGSVRRRGGAQQRQRDGVVAADGHERGAVLGEVHRVLLDRLDGLADVERVHRHVPGVHHLGLREGRGVRGGVVRAQQPRGLPHVAGPEACTGAVGDAGVERHADHLDLRGDAGRGRLVQARQQRVGGGAAVAGHEGGVHGAEAAVVLDAGDLEHLDVLSGRFGSVWSVWSVRCGRAGRGHAWPTRVHSTTAGRSSGLAHE